MGERRTEQGRGWRNRSLVRERDGYFTRHLWRTFFGIVVALAPLGLYLACKSACTQVAYEVNRLSAQREELIEAQRRVNADRARLESPDRIEDWARHRSDLIRPGTGGVLMASRPTGDTNNLVARELPRATVRRRAE